MTSSNKAVVPSAREALNKFKMEAAAEVGVNLKQGYNGDLSAREAGSVGGQMVNFTYPRGTFTYTRKARSTPGHRIQVTYNSVVG